MPLAGRAFGRSGFRAVQGDETVMILSLGTCQSVCSDQQGLWLAARAE